MDLRWWEEHNQAAREGDCAKIRNEMWGALDLDWVNRGIPGLSNWYLSKITEALGMLAKMESWELVGMIGERML